MELEKFKTIVEKVINNLEGGYYHPLMYSNGTIKDKRYATSGETMFGIDRLNGGSINTNTAGKKFWSLIDNADAKHNWAYGYGGGALAPQLKKLAGEMLYPEYETWSKKYFTAETKKIVDSSDALTFHMAYATWNGPGWFKKFASDLNYAVAHGTTDPKKLVQVAIDSRTKEGLHEGDPPNSLIAQGGVKISDIFGNINSAILNPTEFVKKNVKPVAIFITSIAFFGIGLFLILHKR